MRRNSKIVLHGSHACDEMCTESDERRCWKEEKTLKITCFSALFSMLCSSYDDDSRMRSTPFCRLVSRTSRIADFFSAVFSLSLIRFRLLSKCGKFPSSRQSFSSGWVYRTSSQLCSLADGIANRSGKLKRSENNTQVEGKRRIRSFSVQRKKSFLWWRKKCNSSLPKKEITLKWQWASSQHFLKSINRVFFSEALSLFALYSHRHQSYSVLSKKWEKIIFEFLTLEPQSRVSVSSLFCVFRKSSSSLLNSESDSLLIRVWPAAVLSSSHRHWNNANWGQRRRARDKHKKNSEPYGNWIERPERRTQLFRKANKAFLASAKA